MPLFSHLSSATTLRRVFVPERVASAMQWGHSQGHTHQGLTSDVHMCQHDTKQSECLAITQCREALLVFIRPDTWGTHWPTVLGGTDAPQSGYKHVDGSRSFACVTLADPSQSAPLGIFFLVSRCRIILSSPHQSSDYACGHVSCERRPLTIIGRHSDGTCNHQLLVNHRRNANITERHEGCHLKAKV